MTTRKPKMWRWLLLAAAPVLTSCSAEPAPKATAPSNDYNTHPTSASQPFGAHWVQDQRLRLVMAQLSTRNPTWPAGLPQEPESKVQPKDEQFEEVATLATALGDAASRIPEVAGGINMTEADHRGFLAEAQTLRDQAARLEAAARDRNIEQMQLQMDAINSTCISCHSRYRDFSGLLNSPRAAIDPAANVALSLNSK